MAQKLILRKAAKSGVSPKLRKLKVKLGKISDNAQKEKKSVVKTKIRKRKTELATRPAEELNKSGDQRGMHNAGNSEHMKKVRAMRKFYGPKIPVLECNKCSISTNCPQFRAGYECAFTPFLKSHGIKDEADLVQYMKELLGANLSRMHLALIMERVTGERPSLEISEQMNSMFEQLARLTQMERDNDSTEIEFETDDRTIIGQLFGGIGNLTQSTEEALQSNREENLLLDAHQEEIIDVDVLPEDSQLDLIKDFKIRE